jgi:hypothetical protein
MYLGHSFSIELFLAYIRIFCVQKLASASVLAESFVEKVFAHFCSIALLNSLFCPLIFLSMSVSTLSYNIGVRYLHMDTKFRFAKICKPK